MKVSMMKPNRWCCKVAVGPSLPVMYVSTTGTSSTHGVYTVRPSWQPTREGGEAARRLARRLPRRRRRKRNAASKQGTHNRIGVTFAFAENRAYAHEVAHALGTALALHWAVPERERS
jgi:hypothetical protein